MIKAFFIGGHKHCKREALDMFHEELRYPIHKTILLNNKKPCVDISIDYEYNIRTEIIPDEIYRTVMNSFGTKHSEYLTHDGCYVYLKSTLNPNKNKSYLKYRKISML